MNMLEVGLVFLVLGILFLPFGIYEVRQNLHACKQLSLFAKVIWIVGTILAAWQLESLTGWILSIAICCLGFGIVCMVMAL